MYTNIIASLQVLIMFVLVNVSSGAHRGVFTAYVSFVSFIPGVNVSVTHANVSPLCCWLAG